LNKGADPVAILDDCREAMTIVGKRFEAGQAFVPDLIFAGENINLWGEGGIRSRPRKDARGGRSRWILT
jgi:methanogenic corrinoid protein MtbC1